MFFHVTNTFSFSHFVGIVSGLNCFLDSNLCFSVTMSTVVQTEVEYPSETNPFTLRYAIAETCHAKQVTIGVRSDLLHFRHQEMQSSFATVCSNSFVGPFVVWHQRTEGTGNNFTFHLAPGKGKLRGGGRLVVDEVKGLLQTRLR